MPPEDELDLVRRYQVKGPPPPPPSTNVRGRYQAQDYSVFAYDRASGILKKAAMASMSEACLPVGQPAPAPVTSACRHFYKLTCPNCVGLKRQAGSLAEMPMAREALNVGHIRAGLHEQGKIQNPNLPRTRYGISRHEDGTLTNFFPPGTNLPPRRGSLSGTQARPADRASVKFASRTGAVP
jgi:hypothetical protein